MESGMKWNRGHFSIESALCSRQHTTKVCECLDQTESSVTPLRAKSHFDGLEKWGNIFSTWPTRSMTTKTQ